MFKFGVFWSLDSRIPGKSPPESWTLQSRISSFKYSELIFPIFCCLQSGFQDSKKELPPESWNVGDLGFQILRMVLEPGLQDFQSQSPQNLAILGSCLGFSNYVGFHI